MPAKLHDEARTAFAALRQPGEQVLRSPKLVESPVVLSRLPLALDACISRLHCLPQLVIDDSQLWYVLGNPLRRRIHPRDSLAGVRVLQKSLAIPYQTADVQLIVENADAAFRASVNRAGAPERPTRSADTFGIESLRDLLRRRAGRVVAEDAPNDRGFLRHDLSLACGDEAVSRAAARSGSRS